VHVLFSFGLVTSCSSRISSGMMVLSLYWVEAHHHAFPVPKAMTQECREKGKELITLAIVEHQWRQAIKTSFSLVSDLKSLTWVGGNTAGRRYTRKNL
jgi:hypothetical protein